MGRTAPSYMTVSDTRSKKQEYRVLRSEQFRALDFQFRTWNILVCRQTPRTEYRFLMSKQFKPPIHNSPHNLHIHSITGMVSQHIMPLRSLRLQPEQH